MATTLPFKGAIPKNQLTSAEKALVAAVESGSQCDVSGSQIRAAIIYELAVFPGDRFKVHPKGIEIKNAVIDEELNFQSAEILRSLLFIGVSVSEPVILNYSHAKTVAFARCTLHSVTAHSAYIDGLFALNWCEVTHGVDIRTARIGRQLSCVGSTFLSRTKEWAIVADGVTVDGDVLMRSQAGRRFIAIGGINFRGAQIAGHISFEGALLMAARAQWALQADSISAGDGIFLRASDQWPFEAIGGVDLHGSKIQRQIDCDGGKFFAGKNDWALMASGVSVDGSVFLRARANQIFEATGAVSLVGSTINEQFACIECSLRALSSNWALIASELAVGGDVFFCGTENRPFKAIGRIGLLRANIAGSFRSNGSGFHANSAEFALDLEGVQIGGALELHFSSPPVGKLRLEHASVGQLFDAREKWPTEIELDGFTYRSLGKAAPVVATERLAWLRRQPHGEGIFYPQPYEQLARVLRQMGHEADARKILIAKQNDMRAWSGMPWHNAVWNWILGVTVGHGYRPWYPLIWALALILPSWVLFDNAADPAHQIMVPSHERVYLDPAWQTDGSWLPPEYPRFCAALYAADVFLPIVDLHQEDYWLPRSDTTFGVIANIWMWVLIALGWIFTTLFVAGFTGIVKKD